MTKTLYFNSTVRDFTEVMPEYCVYGKTHDTEYLHPSGYQKVECDYINLEPYLSLTEEERSEVGHMRDWEAPSAKGMVNAIGTLRRFLRSDTVDRILILVHKLGFLDTGHLYDGDLKLEYQFTTEPTHFELYIDPQTGQVTELFRYNSQLDTQLRISLDFGGLEYMIYQILGDINKFNINRFSPASFNIRNQLLIEKLVDIDTPLPIADNLPLPLMSPFDSPELDRMISEEDVSAFHTSRRQLVSNLKSISGSPYQQNRLITNEITLEELNAYFEESQSAELYEHLLNEEDRWTNQIEKVQVSSDTPLSILINLSESDDSDAQLELGWRYFNGSGVEKDKEEGVYWIERSAELENPKAMTDMALFYLRGDYLDRNFPSAYMLLSVASSLDYAPAHYNLGAMYANGDGVPMNIPQSIRLYKKAADVNYPDAEFNLGLFAVMGINDTGLSKDEGIEMLRSAAKAGHVQARLECERNGYGDGIPF